MERAPLAGPFLLLVVLRWEFNSSVAVICVFRLRSWLVLAGCGFTFWRDLCIPFVCSWGQFATFTVTDWSLIMKVKSPGSVMRSKSLLMKLRSSREM